MLQLPLEGAQEIVGYGNNVPAPPGPRNLASVGRTSSQNIPAAASTNRQIPAAKKQKLNHASDDQSAASASEPAKVKQELAVSKQAKVPNWAPEGYYYVKAVSFLPFFCKIIRLIFALALPSQAQAKAKAGRGRRREEGSRAAGQRRNRAFGRCLRGRNHIDFGGKAWMESQLTRNLESLGTGSWQQALDTLVGRKQLLGNGRHGNFWKWDSFPA
jgi:hypothetical protein